MPVSKRSTPKNVTVAPAPSFVLAHDGASYTFHPRGEEVVIEFRKSRHQQTSTVPVVEARVLWRNLILKGYERF